MFDTSIIRAAAAPRRYGLLTASVVLHSAVLVGGVAASIGSTRFPNQAPDQVTLFRPVIAPVIPPPLGRPDAPRRENQATPQQPKQQVAPQQQTAPVAVPDETPILEPGTAPIESPSSEPGTGGPGYGSPKGVDGGSGEVEPQAPSEVLTPGGEVRRATVIRRVEPRYPTAMLAARFKEVTVTVHCVIGKNGSVRDAQVVRSSFAAFNESVLDAVRQWTFTPGTLRGQPVDTYFELTVRFQVR